MLFLKTFCQCSNGFEKYTFKVCWPKLFLPQNTPAFTLNLTLFEKVLRVLYPLKDKIFHHCKMIEIKEWWEEKTEFKSRPRKKRIPDNFCPSWQLLRPGKNWAGQKFSC